MTPTSLAAPVAPRTGKIIKSRVTKLEFTQDFFERGLALNG